jgi:hypothetical protein
MDAASELIRRHRATEAELKLQMLRNTLEEVEAYLDNRADVDDGVPNEAMRLLVEVRTALRVAR